MGATPGWRLPFSTPSKTGGRGHKVLPDAFKAGNLLYRLGGPLQWERSVQCTAIARSTGARCRKPALTGATRCMLHHGLIAAAKAEAERYGRVVIIRRNPQKTRLAALGKEPMPEGFPWRADFNVCGPLARGRLYEAFVNRLMAPDVWEKEWKKPRKYRKPGDPR